MEKIIRTRENGLAYEKWYVVYIADNTMGGLEVRSMWQICKKGKFNLESAKRYIRESLLIKDPGITFFG